MSELTLPIADASVTSPVAAAQQDSPSIDQADDAFAALSISSDSATASAAPHLFLQQRQHSRLLDTAAQSADDASAATGGSTEGDSEAVQPPSTAVASTEPETAGLVEKGLETSTVVESSETPAAAAIDVTAGERHSDTISSSPVREATELPAEQNEEHKTTSSATMEHEADPEVAAVAAAEDRGSSPAPQLPSKPPSPAPALPPKAEAPVVPPKAAADSPPDDSTVDASPSSPSVQSQSVASTIVAGPSAGAAATPSKPQVPATSGSLGAPTSATGIRVGKGPPPTTLASEERPFDFNRFLEQMRTRSAAPVGEYVRSFIKGFTKKPYRVSDQTKLIFDFLAFISGVMRQTAPFATLSEQEFENALEAMEKLIMNRLYTYTFSPVIAREGKWKVQTDDLERDRVFRQRVRLFGWIKEEHLDVPQGDHSRGFIDFAVQELSKINHYKAPRDKLICILNCCKVIFGMIRHLSSQESADTFIPILIFVVLKAGPDNLISNVEYISRFRNPDRLSSESGYYLSSLMGAIAFIETMDYTSLSNITQEVFERNVEEAITELAAQPPDVPSTPEHGLSGHDQSASMGDVMGPGDEASAKLIAPIALSIAEDTRAFFQRTGEVAKAGLGASLGRPMASLGRLLSDGLEGARTPSTNAGSGTASPSGGGAESPGPATGGRRLFSGFFGGDDEPSTGTPSRPSSTNASWSRAFRGPVYDPDEEPRAPMSDELRSAPFSSMAAQQAPDAPRRTRRGTPGFPGQIETSHQGGAYRDDDDDSTPLTGVQTPTDDGYSDGFRSRDSPMPPGRAARSGQFADQLADFQPSFLAETPSRRANPPHALAGQQERAGQLTDDLAIESAEISRVHLAAGVETLKSVFPNVETAVVSMVLESCNGDVQASIDKLLEMS